MSTQVTVTVSPLEQEGYTLVTLRGQIDESNLAELKNSVDPLSEDEQVKALLFHVQDLEFINSRVIGYFLSLYPKMVDAEKSMVFVEANSGIMEILSLVGLTMLINHYDSLEEALEALANEE